MNCKHNFGIDVDLANLQLGYFLLERLDPRVGLGKIDDPVAVLDGHDRPALRGHVDRFQAKKANTPGNLGARQPCG